MQLLQEFILWCQVNGVQTTFVEWGPVKLVLQPAQAEGQDFESAPNRPVPKNMEDLYKHFGRRESATKD